MKDIEHLFKLFELTSNEFYLNGENRWKFFKTFGALLSALIAAAYKLPELATPLLIITSFVSLGGILILVSVYRTIVSIDQILTGLQKEILLTIFEDEKDKVDSLLYPESTQFLRGASYVFSIHSAMVIILGAFFLFSTVRLLNVHVSQNASTLAVATIVLGVAVVWMAYHFSNLSFTSGELDEEADDH